MTIPYVAGWGDSVANALPQISQNILGVMNPGGLGFDQMQALKAAILKDPDTVRKYASIERDKPGTLEKMGFGKRFGMALGMIPPTTEEILGQQKTRGEIAESGARTNYYNSESKVADLNAQTAQNTLDLKKIENQRIISGMRKTALLSGKDLTKIASDFSIGKIEDPATITAIQADPQMAPQFQSLVSNILDRAKLALEQHRMDHLDKSEKQVALRFALQNQREAEQRLKNVEVLQQKYSDPKKLQMDRILATSNPQIANEVAQYDQLVQSNFSEVEDAKKDATSARALTQGALRDNPDFARILRKQESDQAIKDKQDTDTQNTIAGDSKVQQAREAIQKFGKDALISKPIWKTLTPDQQKAALAPIDNTPTPTTSTPKKVSATPSITTPTSTTPDIPSPGAYGNLGMGSGVFPTSQNSAPPSSSPNQVSGPNPAPMSLPLTQPSTAKGPGVGSTISGSKLTPYEAFVMQARDMIAGREIGDYSDSIDPIYNQQPGQALSPMMPQYGARMPNAGQYPTVGPSLPR